MSTASPSATPTGPTPIAEEVRAFVGTPDSPAEVFDDLAARVLARQLRHYPTYGALAEGRGVEPATLEAGQASWTAVPPMPTSAFAHLALHIGTPGTIFRSSGTTREGAPRSQHHHADLDLYRHIVDRSFPGAVLGETEPRANSRTLLSLIPPISLVGDSSLGFMVDHAMSRWADDRSRYAFDAEGLAPEKALEWLRTSATEAEHPVMLTTALALWAVLDAAEQDGLGTWPGDLRIMETGGFKTERFRLTRDELLRRLRDLTGIRAQRVVREYGMTELTSQAYTNPSESPVETRDLFRLPHWTRVRVLDPQTLDDVEPGDTGLLAFLDLGNADSAAYVLTEDLGRLPTDAAGTGRCFELLGRARDAQLRGCSLTTEQLLRP